jgi:hypothetical protein
MPKQATKSFSTSNQIAMRYVSGVASKVKRELRRFGHLAVHVEDNLMVLTPSDSASTDLIQQYLDELLRDGVMSFVTPVLTDRHRKLKQILTNEIIVRFRRVPTKKTLRGIQVRFGVMNVEQNEFVPRQYLMKVNAQRGNDVLKMTRAFNRTKSVEFATPNYFAEHAR